MVTRAQPILTRLVPMDYPAANQTLAAIDSRIYELQHFDIDVAAELMALQRARVAIRETFGLGYTIGQRRAMHEAAEAQDPDGPVADCSVRWHEYLDR